jgi:hypothetical protein
MRDYAGTLPVLLDLDLYDAGWNGSLRPYPGISNLQFAMQHLRRSITKKLCGRNSKDADKRALDLFLKVNEQCRTWSLSTSSITEPQAFALQESKEFISRFFEKYEQESDCVLRILSLGKVSQCIGLGSGANIGAYSNDFLSKVGTSDLTATNQTLFLYYKEAIRDNPLWSDVESIRSLNRKAEIVRGSRLSFVPKTTEISRTICTEPLLNMFFQKGLASILTKRLEEISGINLSRQPVLNQKLAQLGSKEGKFGTIDLSSASDSMSLGLVREFFPPHVVSWLEMTRSPCTILPDGTEVELHMVSSMGNAFTFPLQTLFFCSLVYGAYKSLGIHFQRPSRRSLGSFAVFGDDIIVNHLAYNHLCELLRLCGFSVNVDKSFNDGFFRESCGHDYYCGYNVRGVYLKQLTDVCDSYSAINRLNIWSATHRIPLCRTVQFLLKGNRLLPIPMDEVDTAGIKVHSSHLKKKVLDKFTSGIQYRYIHIKAQAFSVTDVELRPPRLRGWINNPPAVLLAALAGTLRSGKVVTRGLSQRSTRIRMRYSSRWDYIPSEMGVSPSFGGDWKFFIELNLNFS